MPEAMESMYRPANDEACGECALALLSPSLGQLSLSCLFIDSCTPPPYNEQC